MHRNPIKMKVKWSSRLLDLLDKRYICEDWQDRSWVWDCKLLKLKRFICTVFFTLNHLFLVLEMLPPSGYSAGYFAHDKFYFLLSRILFEGLECPSRFSSGSTSKIRQYDKWHILGWCILLPFKRGKFKNMSRKAKCYRYMYRVIKEYNEENA